MHCLIDFRLDTSPNAQQLSRTCQSADGGWNGTEPLGLFLFPICLLNSPDETYLRHYIRPFTKGPLRPPQKGALTYIIALIES
ncbi:predicted protein [Uncinocarpus reesii 1704]|uniref:Uncharacterized protein n=1 Tax=Uncinocarpus reesii (strain UAMH 1704) TaxID=336963 RepID=C4JVN6_UNCRE|nr:uncharacterized protein UREG_06628 [Uncinocarpus reesii 1704]EEP81763.1 predicted protein [Uncinocarpus reesii 1704]